MSEIKSRILILCLSSVFFSSSCGGSVKEPVTAKEDIAQNKEKAVEPAVTAVVFVMSRCTYCAELLRTLLSLREQMNGLVEISLGWIGRTDSLGRAVLETSDDEVRSAELQICAGLVSSKEQWFGFLKCLYSEDSWKSLPDGGWEHCADITGIERTKINKCIGEGDGLTELEKSVEISASEGVESAPTLFISGRHYLGDRSTKSLIAHICHEMGKRVDAPMVCKEVAPLPALPATLIEDMRCDDASVCDVSRELAFLETMLPTMKLTRLDFSSKEGRHLYDLIVLGGGPRHLPILVLDGALKEYTGEREALGKYILEFGKKGYLMPLGRGWDPLEEKCNNGIDDDEDGIVDCDDSSCRGALDCRQEKPGSLDLFIMSRCPFAMDLIPEVQRFLKHVDSHREKIDFKLQFIGEVVDGELESMHGSKEVEENLRMICTQELYSKDLAFMDYVTCRAKDYISENWKACVPKKMDIAKIEKCSKGKTGKELLKRSYELSRETGILGSPTWLLNNAFETSAFDAPSILKTFCTRNDFESCDYDIEPLSKRGDVDDERCE